VDGRRLSTRPHKDFVAKQRAESIGSLAGLESHVSAGSEGAGEGEDEGEVLDATEVYITEVPEGHEVRMTISPFMKLAGAGADQDVYVTRAGSSGASFLPSTLSFFFSFPCLLIVSPTKRPPRVVHAASPSSRGDRLAQYYDETLLAGCYQLDATSRAEMLEQKSGKKASHDLPESFEIGTWPRGRRSASLSTCTFLTRLPACLPAPAPQARRGPLCGPTWTRRGARSWLPR